METQAVERKLAAILAADVVSNGRLIEADEAGTIPREKADRDEFINFRISEYGGQIVRTNGDGLPVEFPSVVDAPRGEYPVVDVGPQEGISEESRIVSRVGINLGYIIIDGDDIYADGVNVAARLDTWPSRRAGNSAQEAVTVMAKSHLATASAATEQRCRVDTADKRTGRTRCRQH
jgi:adenylate cyclase